MATKINKASSEQKVSACKPESLHEEIRKKAYHIWQEEGKPNGKDWDIWLKAEKEVCAVLKK